MHDALVLKDFLKSYKTLTIPILLKKKRRQISCFGGGLKSVLNDQEIQNIARWIENETEWEYNEQW